MKNIKKWLAVALVIALCLSMTGCMTRSSQVTGTATLETSEVTLDGEETAAKDPSAFEDGIQGLCAYMEDCEVTAGERIQMEYGVIGAINGYKYTYTYEGSQVQLEVYEFPTEDIPELAQTVIDSVKANGSFELLDNVIPAQISENGRYMLIYTDEKTKKEEANQAHKEHVVECFETFTAR